MVMHSILPIDDPIKTGLQPILFPDPVFGKSCFKPVTIILSKVKPRCDGALTKRDRQVADGRENANCNVCPMVSLYPESTSSESDYAYSDRANVLFSRCNIYHFKHLILSAC